MLSNEFIYRHIKCKLYTIYLYIYTQLAAENRSPESLKGASSKGIGFRPTVRLCGCTVDRNALAS